MLPSSSGIEMARSKSHAEIWSEMVSRSFNPREWFEIDDDELSTEDTLMWVYKLTESNLYTVGFYDPKGEWQPESVHPSKKDAAARVHYLNGGAQ